MRQNLVHPLVVVSVVMYVLLIVAAVNVLKNKMDIKVVNIYAHSTVTLKINHT